jgi:hypothetical protein
MRSTSMLSRCAQWRTSWRDTPAKAATSDCVARPRRSKDRAARCMLSSDVICVPYVLSGMVELGWQGPGTPIPGPLASFQQVLKVRLLLAE